MKSNYARCLELVLKSEGGYSNNPADPGAKTMQGITQRVYDAYRDGKGRARQTVRSIADYELAEIYAKQYWQPISGDDLPAGLDYITFDAAVNSGVTRGATWLQVALGVAADGHIGVITLAATKQADASAIVRNALDNRMVFLKGLKTWPDFGKGWTNRIDNVRRDALSMIAEYASATPAPSPVMPQSMPGDPGVLPLAEGPPAGFWPAFLTLLKMHGIA